MQPIILALGSNLGDRLDALNRACRLLENSGVRIVRRSKLYWARPWNGNSRSGAGILPTKSQTGSLGHASNQSWYLNAAIEVHTPLHPLELLWRCREIERRMGRFHRERWEPRVLDLDLIFYGNLRVNHPDLQIPHPRWAERDFVLAPILNLSFTPPASMSPQGRKSLISFLSRSEPCILAAARWICRGTSSNFEGKGRKLPAS